MLRCLIEYALKDEINRRHEEDPAFYSSLRARLEKILDDRRAKRIDAAQKLQLSEALKRDAQSRAEAATAIGLSETGLALYGLLVVAKTVTASDHAGALYGAPLDEPRRALAEILEDQLAPRAAIIDWTHKDEVQREMRQIIKRQLRAAGYDAGEIDALAASVVDLLKRRKPAR
jgi:type I restriction enzyme, R subunit